MNIELYFTNVFIDDSTSLTTVNVTKDILV